MGPVGRIPKVLLFDGFGTVVEGRAALGIATSFRRKQQSGWPRWRLPRIDSVARPALPGPVRGA
jgi:hypothetical protein